ncbi:ATP-binding protein [Bacteroides propionicifaciens]|uniref:ATP-binding protein n=1 Tax=Bacteroides propionicifaciens TaxID=392838 RepID=UPI00035E040C|nr:ATP-binding protein [Bacteroides propionicifaciens]
MEAPSKHIKVKLILGFSSLLVVLLLTLWFLYANVRVLTQLDDDSVLNTDSISLLIQQKDSKTTELIHSFSQLNTNLKVSSINLDKLLLSKEPVPIVKTSIKLKADTVLTKPKKKRFFRRLAEAFSPSKMDSTVKVRTYEEIAVDTFYQSSIRQDTADTKLIVEIKESLEAERRLVQKRTYQTNQLKKISKQLSLQIDSILSNYDKARVDDLLNRIRSSNESRQTAVQWVGIIALVAILLTIVFSILLVRDINKRNKYRIALERANRRAEDLLQAREKLMLTITHDIKAPIGTIMGYSELLNDTALTQEQKSFLLNIDKATNHAYRLIYDLLDYHSLDLNKANINTTVFNIYDLLLEIEGFFIPQFKAKGLEFITDFNSSKLNQWIESDRMRLAQILTNLLSNAKKFTNVGRVELFASMSNGQLVFRVTDTGVGMSEYEKNKAFKEFTRLPNAQGQEGVGLGLSIVSKIVECLNGFVSIESTLGKGSRFTVQIPVRQLNSREIGDKDSLKVEFPEGTRILLLDDDKIQLKLTALILRKYGAEVLTCNTTDEVFLALKSKTYSLLITDIQMPEMDGFKFLNLLRSCNIDTFKTIPVLAMSARTFMDETKFVKAGFIGVLKKPFQAIDVINKLEVVENRVLQQEVEPEFSLNTLQEFVGDDKLALDSILQSFVADGTAQAEALNLAIKDGNWQEVVRTAHKLLPLVKMLGQPKLSELLSMLDSDRTDFDKHEIVNLALIKLQDLTGAIAKYLKTK